MSSKNEICIHTCVAIILRKEVTQIRWKTSVSTCCTSSSIHGKGSIPQVKTHKYMFFFSRIINILFLKLLHIIIVIFFFYYICLNYNYKFYT